MSLADEYRRQLSWRCWEEILDGLPPVADRTVLDLGCGVGDVAAALAARGARVIAIDGNEELLAVAETRSLANVEFRKDDLRTFTDPGTPVDGLWSSFAAAYFPDLAGALALWTTRLRAGGWVALTEVDDMFGHHPLPAGSRALLDAYADEARSLRRYDFHMGRRLAGEMERAGLVRAEVLTVADPELSFEGPAPADVTSAWCARFDRMRGLREFCGSRYERVRDEFLECLTRSDHRSSCTVYRCLAFGA